SLATPDTCASQTVPASAPAQRVQQMQGDSRAAGAERMTDGDRSTIHVGALAVQPQLLLDRQILGGKRLVYFNEIHIVEFQSRPLQRLAGGGSRTDPHDAGLDPGAGPGKQPAQRTELSLGGKASTREHQRGGAVTDA